MKRLIFGLAAFGLFGLINPNIAKAGQLFVDTSPGFGNGDAGAASIGEGPMYTGSPISSLTTFGQTFLLTGTNISMDSFSVYVDHSAGPGNVNFGLTIMQWDGTKAVGVPLFQSPVVSTVLPASYGNHQFENFTFNTGGLALTSGQAYVAILGSWNHLTGVVGYGLIGAVGGNGPGYNPFTAGSLFELLGVTGLSDLTTTPWLGTEQNFDLAFQATFSGNIDPLPPQLSPPPPPPADTPEPSTLTLLGIGIAGMAGYGWRSRKKGKLYFSRTGG